MARNKRDLTLPLSLKDVRSMLSSWKCVPYLAVKDLIEWNCIHKSPYSFSFYNKPKDWLTTETGTLRISDHWNFLSAKRGRDGVKITPDKLHAKTDTIIEQGVWYKGIYDETLDTYIIVATYGIEEMSYEQYVELRNSIPLEQIEFPADLIEKRRDFSNKIKSGLVAIKVGNGFNTVKKLTKYRIDFLDGQNTITLKSEDKGFVISNPIYLSEFVLSIEGNFYSEESFEVYYDSIFYNPNKI